MQIFDGHYHTLMPMRMEDTIKSLKKSFEENGVSKITLLSCPFYESRESDLLQNVKNLFLKHYFGENVYAFAGLEHYLDMPYKEWSKNFLEQAKEYIQAGFDGMKMLEGKPCTRKLLDGRLVSDECYDEFYDFLEKEGVPVTMHNADPCEFWDKSKLSAYALAHGWFNDETHLPKDAMTQDVFSLMEKHPKLRLTLAHWGFMMDDYDYAERFLSAYEHTMLDTTPAGEEYMRMVQAPTLWRDFLIKHQDRIKYGTDTYNFHLNEDYLRAVHVRPDFVKRFFETADEFDYVGNTFVGVALPENVLEKIYFQNGIREYGAPKAVNVEYLKEKLTSLRKVVQEQSALDDVDFMLAHI